MRWFIEVSSGNPTGPAEQWVVEASQWQPALQAARALRGESVETTGFSIELLEDGFRVIDPATLVRYVVRRAPDGTPLSSAAPKALATVNGDAHGQEEPVARVAQDAAKSSAEAASAIPKENVLAEPPDVVAATNGDDAGAPQQTSPPSAPQRSDVPSAQGAAAAASKPASPTASTEPRAAGPARSTPPPSSVAPTVDMSGMTQAERIAAMLSVEAAPRSSRAPRTSSATPKATPSKNAPRSAPAASSRNGGVASSAPRPASEVPSSTSASVLRAPQGAALRAPRAAAVEAPRAVSRPPSAVPAPEVPAVQASPPISVVAAPAAAAAAETTEKVQAPRSVPLAAATEPAAHAPRPSSVTAPSQPPPPRLITHPPTEPAVVQSLSELQALVHPTVPRPTSQPVPPTPSQQPPHADVPPVTEAPRVSPSGYPSPSSPPEPLPMAELLFQRSEDPSAASPLTYREAAWAVPEGTSVAAAVRLLAGMFEGVRAALAGTKPGKLVYMAIFDHRFVGKPTRPPLATLTWKDWKDLGQGPEIRRQGEPRTSFQPPPVAISDSFIPAAVPQPVLVVPAAPSAHPAAAVVAVAPAVSAVPVSAPPPAVSEVPVASAPPPSARVAPMAEPLASAPVAPVAVHLAPAAEVDTQQPPAVTAPPVVAPALVVPPAASSVAPTADAPPSAPAPGAPKLVIVPEVTPLPLITPATRPSAPSAPAVRLSGVELIADLFECMHDLHFLTDALAGADFVISLMLDKLPSASALVHFYDIDAREFVVVRAVGTGAAKVMQIRTSEKEPLIAEAMRKRRAVVIGDAAGDPRAQNGRWALLGDPPRTLVCAPVEEGGRFLGLIELSNPLDSQPFHEGDGHAITYIGEQFAEFLAERGVILDPDRIGD